MNALRFRSALLTQASAMATTAGSAAAAPRCCCSIKMQAGAPVGSGTPLAVLPAAWEASAWLSALCFFCLGTDSRRRLVPSRLLRWRLLEDSFFFGSGRTGRDCFYQNGWLLFSVRLPKVTGQSMDASPPAPHIACEWAYWPSFALPSRQKTAAITSNHS